MGSSLRWTILLAFAAVSMKGAHGILCYSCQYSDNAGLVGWECVTSPADYTLGPTTVQCPGDCSSEIQKYGGTQTVYFMTRGCRNKDPGCTVGSLDTCVETCSSPDLCNGANYDPGTLPPTSPAGSTLAPTTTTEIPGTISCYSCVYSYHPEGDDTCVTNAELVPPPSEVRCDPSRYCTTFRQYDKGEGVVRSFRRGCDPYTGQVDECIEDTYFITCNLYCNTPYCNNQDGSMPLAGKGIGNAKAKKDPVAIKI
jgi:hypothetical protein